MNKETDLARYFRSIGIRPTFTNNKIYDENRHLIQDMKNSGAEYG